MSIEMNRLGFVIPSPLVTRQRSERAQCETPAELVRLKGEKTLRFTLHLSE
jgi:hypothetical protein